MYESGFYAIFSRKQFFFKTGPDGPSKRWKVALYAKNAYNLYKKVVSVLSSVDSTVICTKVISVTECQLNLSVFI